MVNLCSTLHEAGLLWQDGTPPHTMEIPYNNPLPLPPPSSSPRRGSTFPMRHRLHSSLPAAPAILPHAKRVNQTVGIVPRRMQPHNIRPIRFTSYIVALLYIDCCYTIDANGSRKLLNDPSNLGNLPGKIRGM